MSFVKTRPMPTQEELRRLLDYNPETGELIWLARPDNARWTTRFAGTAALTALVHGYRHGHIAGVKYRAHRVIFKWMTGSEPDEVDHFNGRRADNRWANLRPATRTINARNVGISKANTSGASGVIWEKRRQRWCARAQIAGKTHHIGSFDCVSSASAARAAFLRDKGFTDRHIGAGGAA